MSVEKVNNVLKWVVIVLFCVLILLIFFYKIDDCDICKFNYNKTEMNAKGFFEGYYSPKCFSSADPINPLEWNSTKALN